jgi:membrane fusion protein, multidrug efflux system
LRGAEDVVLTAPSPGGGRVLSLAETGTRVARGDALCDIDGELYESLLKQAQAAVDLAKGERDRTRENVKQGFLGKAALDKAELDFQNARAALAQARRAHADSRCEAPFAGVLVSRFIDRHQTAPPGAPTVRVADLRVLEARVAIPETEASEYREGQSAEFTALGGRQGETRLKGVIAGLDRSVESRNRVVHARVRLENPGEALRPGMIGNVGVLRRRHADALVVPSPAVLRLQEGTAVMVVVDSIAHQVPVTLGPSRDGVVVVASGLSAGDRIITAGAFQVSEGTRVEF